MSKRKTKEEWQIQSDAIHNGEFHIIGEPKSAMSKVDILHKKCGNIINMSLHNHVKRYCAYCSGKIKKTIDDCQQLSDVIHNGEFTILEYPNNIKGISVILHKRCGNHIRTTMNNHLSHGNGCGYCSNVFRKSHEYWIDKCIEIWGDEFEILDKIETTRSKVRVKHNLCGNVLIKDMSNFIHNKRGCNICTRKSYGEFYIKEYFDRNMILYTTQKTFNGLVNPKTGRMLKVDFYLPEYDIVFEIDGVQHYKSIKHWGGDSAYVEQVYRDNLKNLFFGDKLIRINNKKIKDIENICQQLKQRQNTK